MQPYDLADEAFSSPSRVLRGLETKFALPQSTELVEQPEQSARSGRRSDSSEEVLAVDSLKTRLQL